MIPVVGWFVTPFASFFVAIVAANLWAGGFNHAMETSSDVVRTSGEESAV